VGTARGHRHEVVEALEVAYRAVGTPVAVALDDLLPAEGLNKRFESIPLTAAQVVALVLVIAAAVGTGCSVAIRPCAVRREIVQQFLFAARDASSQDARET